MVSELKNPLSGKHGVIIFTHKERQLLSSKNQSVKNSLRRLQENNLLGMHWGHYIRRIPKIPFIAFHLASPGTVGYGHDKIINWIPLSSRNFVDPIFFQHDGTPRVWDILYVCRALKLKNIKELFTIIRKLLDLGHNFSVLLQINAPLNYQMNPSYYAKLKSDYENMFSNHEQSFVVLNFIVSKDPFPIDTAGISALMQQSRIVALLSEREGESRVISEALASNCWVLCKSRLKGGGRDLLSEQNSIQYRNMQTCIEKLIANKTSPQPHKDLKISKAISSKTSSVVLREHLEKFLVERELEPHLGWELSNLDKRLPSHLKTHSDFFDNATTDDLKTELDLIKYICYLLNEDAEKYISEFRAEEVRLNESISYFLRNKLRHIYSKLGAKLGKLLFKY